MGVQGRWKSVTNKQKWRARGATFMAKAKATKAVWFPPKPAATANKAAATAKKSAKRTTRKTTAAAKKTKSAAKKVSA